MTWAEIHQHVDRMFTQQYGTLSRKIVHFYGNDGLCLFKYFVRSDDPRRGRAEQLKSSVLEYIDFHGNMMVWMIMIINLICFILISISYGLINLHTWKSSTKSGQIGNPATVERNKKLETRISFIILTDFLSWVPFIIICALHNVQFIDATGWYVTLAMTMLPINAVINPLLYDRTIVELLEKLFQKPYNGIIDCYNALAHHLTKTPTQKEEPSLGASMELVSMRCSTIKVQNEVSIICAENATVENQTDINIGTFDELSNTDHNAKGRSHSFSNNHGIGDIRHRRLSDSGITNKSRNLFQTL